MISVEEASQLLEDNPIALESENVKLHDSSGRILAADIISPISHPLFNCTAVDGYAFKFEDLNDGNGFSVIGEIQAGVEPNISLNKNEAVRIFTGAPVPESADTVVMQEYTEQNNGIIKINDPGIKPGSNIRIKGDQIKQGEVALTKGTRINASTVGFLASLGIDELRVTCIPKIGMIITGNEFANTEDELKTGKIYESNGPMLQAALKTMDISCNSYQIGADDPELLKDIIRSEAQQNDVLLITGGVSVGDYDFTKPVLEELGFDTVFHKIKQKPGKPLLFSKKENKVAFGLPGNPRSVMVCFYEYVLPFINKIQGIPEPHLTKIQMPLAKDFKKKADEKTHFLAGRINDHSVETLQIQGSHMLKSLSDANCLLVIPENSTEINKGDLVEVHLIN